MALKDELKQLVEASALDFGTYAWKYETDRWAELVFCLLNQVITQDTQTTRTAVQAMQYLGLLDMEELARGESSKNAAFVTYLLSRHGFSNADAARAVQCLAAVANPLTRDFDSKLQRYLRARGGAMRDELVDLFRSPALGDEQVRFAVSHWLQNALGLPVSLEHEAVRKYCHAKQVTVEDLWQAADELDLNMALIDDLLELEMARHASPRGEPRSAE